MKRYLLVTTALLAVAACSDRPQINLGGNYAVALSMPPLENHDIDVLFVVDDSGSMADNQAAVAARAQDALFDVIDNAVGGIPDLHIGVISTNVGVGGYNIPGCVGEGDGGRLQNTNTQAASCANLTDRYLIDVAGEGGTRTQNYSGALADVFACLVQVGTDGCGFEQPLASLERAVSGDVPENAGFLRPGALLVVIVITDEDDCSASDPHTLFDPNDRVTLGPFESFRCFAQSVTCDEADLAAPGEKTHCVARDDSPYIEPLQQTVDALVAAKGGDANQVMVAVIAAPATPVLVGINENNQTSELLASCTDANQDSAAPAIRLEKLLHAFPGRSWFESICGDVAPALRHTANLVGDVAARRPCLRGTLRDVDPATPGVQPSCRAFQVSKPFAADEERTEVPACSGEDGDAPCFRLSADTDTCGDDGALGLRADLVHALTTLDGKSFVVECLLP
jgi:hypothetical protein